LTTSRESQPSSRPPHEYSLAYSGREGKETDFVYPFGEANAELGLARGGNVAETSVTRGTPSRGDGRVASVTSLSRRITGGVAASRRTE